MEGGAADRRRRPFLVYNKIVLLTLTLETGLFGRVKTSLGGGLFVGDRSFWARQDRFWPYHTVFKVGSGLFVGDRSFWARQDLFWPYTMVLV